MSEPHGRKRDAQPQERRRKPRRRSLRRLAREPVVIRPEDCPIVVDTEHKDGKFQVRFTEQ